MTVSGSQDPLVELLRVLSPSKYRGGMGGGEGEGVWTGGGAGAVTAAQ